MYLGMPKRENVPEIYTGERMCLGYTQEGDVCARDLPRRVISLGNAQEGDVPRMQHPICIYTCVLEVTKNFEFFSN